MTAKNLEVISQIVLWYWYENSFRIDCTMVGYTIT